MSKLSSEPNTIKKRTLGTNVTGDTKSKIFEKSLSHCRRPTRELGQTGIRQLEESRAPLPRDFREFFPELHKIPGYARTGDRRPDPHGRRHSQEKLQLVQGSNGTWEAFDKNWIQTSDHGNSKPPITRCRLDRKRDPLKTFREQMFRFAANRVF